MPTLRIFVSFEFDKDNDIKNNFFKQAKNETHHRVKNSSLNESYPDQHWQQKARKAIEKCDVVIVLIGEDTHNAPGVETELRIASQLKKPIFQVKATAAEPLIQECRALGNRSRGAGSASTKSWMRYRSECSANGFPREPCGPGRHPCTALATMRSENRSLRKRFDSAIMRTTPIRGASQDLRVGQ